jgi:hypothetical protein
MLSFYRGKWLSACRRQGYGRLSSSLRGGQLIELKDDFLTTWQSSAGQGHGKFISYIGSSVTGCHGSPRRFKFLVLQARRASRYDGHEPTSMLQADCVHGLTILAIIVILWF